MTDLSTNSYDDLSKAFVKKALKQYTDKPLQVGSSFLQITKASEKWITLTESRKGLVQEHRRNTIENILEYIYYKKTLFFKDDNTSSQEVDPETQSKQYQTQHENFLEIKQDFQAHLEVIFKNYTKLIAFNVDEENFKVIIKLNHDQQIILSLQSPEQNGKTFDNLSIETDQENLHQIINDVSKFKFLKGYQHISELLYVNSKESIHFITTIKKLVAFKKQLKLLMSFVNIDSNDLILTSTADEINQYLRKSKKGDDLCISYEDFIFNGKTYTRKFIIHKITKIRTTVKVISTEKLDEDDVLTTPNKFIEFARTFTKIHQDLTKITTEMHELYVANI